ncbi:hypothetical protein [Burkholderia sp. JKS000303]|uniref:hypothetical protein n=1 Tax=Burkholderia sp. JKS000303 TaxID=1938747 RepID=UPI00117EBA00|nr:hypothetical protein [Burkholderia sp. JKS000303]
MIDQSTLRLARRDDNQQHRRERVTPSIRSHASDGRHAVPLDRDIAPIELRMRAERFISPKFARPDRLTHCRACC